MEQVISSLVSFIFTMMDKYNLSYSDIHTYLLNYHLGRIDKIVAIKTIRMIAEATIQERACIQKLTSSGWTVAREDHTTGSLRDAKELVDAYKCLCILGANHRLAK